MDNQGLEFRRVKANSNREERVLLLLSLTHGLAFTTQQSHIWLFYILVTILSGMITVH